VITFLAHVYVLRAVNRTNQIISAVDIYALPSTRMLNRTTGILGILA